MSVLRVKNGDQWDIVPAIKGDTGDPAADESITDAMLVPDGIKTEIDWLWGNQLMDIREGELLQTDDAYEAPLVSLDVDGNSTQVTTTGKNLFDKRTAINGFYINSAGASAVGSTNSCTGFIPISGGETYALSYGGSLSGGNYIAWYTDADQSTVTGNRVDARNLTSIVMTAPSEAAYIRFSCQTSLLAKVQLELGSAVTSYEEYTGGKPSPSPDYPQNIVSVDEPVFRLYGVNLLDVLNDPSNPDKGCQSSGGGTTVVQYDSTEKAYFTSRHRTISIGHLPVGTYTVSFLCKRRTDGASTAYTQWSSIGSTRGIVAGHQLSNTSYVTATNTLVVTEAISKSNIGIVFYNNIFIKDFQLELGSTATAYEPYTGIITSLLPDGYSLRSLPDGTKDELHLSYLRPSKREGWAWYSRELVKRVAAKTFDGTDMSRWSIMPGSYQAYQYIWTEAGSGAYDWTVLTADDSRCSNCTLNGISTTSNVIGYSNTNYAMRYRYKDMAGVDAHLTDLAAFFADSPVTFMVPMQHSVTTQLDPIELPIMPSKDTTIWSDPSAQLKMTYIQDTNLVIESLEATVADMATS